ncbi:hypothetical protein BaRGS_00026314 [Batillaria attramentaria]|uniref:Uncharacterized protein n=1 Tax=Batillaria attramentaria TaxID=370345 RepID=A0ABD0K4W1_9CAEN
MTQRTKTHVDMLTFIQSLFRSNRKSKEEKNCGSILRRHPNRYIRGDPLDFNKTMKDRCEEGTAALHVHQRGQPLHQREQTHFDILTNILILLTFRVVYKFRVRSFPFPDVRHDRRGCAALWWIQLVLHGTGDTQTESHGHVEDIVFSGVGGVRKDILEKLPPVQRLGTLDTHTPSPLHSTPKQKKNYQFLLKPSSK